MPVTPSAPGSVQVTRITLGSPGYQSRTLPVLRPLCGGAGAAPSGLLAPPPGVVVIAPASRSHAAILVLATPTPQK